MSKELFVTSTPHETKVAIVEDDQLVEIYYERENEYTLAGSIYKGKVTRVLPGMQSAFVDIGLERDAFLYVTDFMELEEEDSDDLDTVQAKTVREEQAHQQQQRGGRRDRGPRGGHRSAQRNDRPNDRPNDHQNDRPGDEPPTQPAAGFEGNYTNDREGLQSAPAKSADQGASEVNIQTGEGGPRRWRGRRGRRRRGGRGREDEGSTTSPQTANGEAATGGDPISFAGPALEEADAFYEQEVEEQILSAPAPVAPAEEGQSDHFGNREERSNRSENRPERGGRERGGRVDRPPQERSAHDRSGREEHGGREDRGGRSGGGAPVILPGESLAKFGRKEETKQPEGQTLAQSQSSYKPSTLVNDVSGFAASGLLAGETLRKYRGRELESSAAGNQEEKFSKRQTRHEPAGSHESMEADTAPQALSQHTLPEQVVAEFKRPENEEPEHREPANPEPAEKRSWLERTPWAQRRAAKREQEKAKLAAGDHIPEPSSASGDRAQSSETADGGEVINVAAPHEHRFEKAEEQHPVPAGPHDFGAGSIEEEVLEAEDEHEQQQLSEYQVGGDDEYDDLEEETLTDEFEGDVMRAGERLAAAVAESKHRGPAEAFLEEELGDEEEPADGEVLAEADFSGADDDQEIDPEDPAYEGSAEHRAPAATAGFQRTQRGGERQDNRRGRGGRNQRDRVMRPRSGGRHNTPRQPLPQINELLKEGQEILVQIAKEPMAKKGARITSHIALPGRFLVYMPSVNHTGVSRKIGSDEERLRLKRILLSEKGTAHGGFIVRTAAAGASEEDLRADIRFLINLWNEIKQRSESGKAPALIYHDLNLVERILRDQVTANFSQIWVDGEQEYERILRFAQRFQPALLKRAKLWTKEVPLFENFGLQEEINKALKSKVWLKSGGYIVINQTEALVAIDINTGKYVGKTSRLEDTIVKTNVDAIKEIVRQIRLRDLGGIIVIDFIDMDERRNRHKVMAELEEALKADRSPSKVLQFNDFGLVAITRKRVKQSLERTLGAQCTYCVGTGFIKSVSTMCNEIYTEMRKSHRHLEGRDITLRVNPEVAKALKMNSGRWLIEMEEMTGKSMIVKSDPMLHQEQFDIN